MSRYSKMFITRLLNIAYITLNNHDVVVYVRGKVATMSLSQWQKYKTLIMYMPAYGKDDVDCE